jgi:predicted nucleotidyltransferase
MASKRKSSKRSDRSRSAATRADSAAQHAVPIDLRPIAPLIERIVARLEPEEIWLFGSRAEGRARPDSDYDLLAVLPDNTPESALDLIKAWELTCGLGVPADLVPCTRSDFEDEKDEVGTLARAAYHRGKRIYERQRRS